MEIAISTGFSHEALFYAGLEEFTVQVARFVREGVESDEPVMVMVGAEKIERLRDNLRADAERVRFIDMEDVGRNPARIIPAWASFFGDSGRPARGVGEPIWPGRTRAELLECQLHESLINLAFTDAYGRLLCPYDVEALESHVIGEARRGHPLVTERSAAHANPRYERRPWLDARFHEALPEPRHSVQEIGFDRVNIASVRELVGRTARLVGLPDHRADDLILAVHELAANSVRHGGGKGTLRLWKDTGSLICEVRDSGQIADPLVGRSLPGIDADSGRGLWMANHLIDLSQIRTTPAGTVVRLHANLVP